MTEAASRGCCRPGPLSVPGPCCHTDLRSPAAFSSNPGILGELCSTLARLAVRNEFCQEVVDLGGLDVLVTLLASCNDHQVGPMSLTGANRGLGFLF